jgi:pimeloyl-ACP methyl ester carboxylesterase
VTRTRTPSDSIGTRTTTVGGRTVAHATYGSPDGTPVVFFHGTPGSRRLGGLWHEEARRADVRLVAIERPGCGRSDGWPARTLADTGRFTVPVLDDLGIDRAGVVGFSGGGPHALALAATRPDRVRRVDVVAGSAPPSVVEAPAVARVLGALSERTPRVVELLLRGQARLAGRLGPSVVVSQYTTDGPPPELTDEAAALLREDFRAAVGGDGRGAAREFALLAAEWDVSPEDVDVPVGLHHGDRDANAPIAGARRLADALPAGDLTVLSGADHLATLLRSPASVLARHG